MTRLEQFLINRKAWISAEQIALRFLCSRTKVYGVVHKLLANRQLEIRPHPKGRGFQYRGKQ